MGSTVGQLTDVQFVVRLLLATACGVVIGLERQYRSRTAGLRTNALVATGAAVFVLFGTQAGVDGAQIQIAAYVVSGVGFLGGGVILRQGFAVQGLNTAATLWCSAAVGCQAAGGHLLPAVVTTAVVLGVHVLLRPVGRWVDRAPAADDESPTACTVHVQVRRKQEPQLRARLLQSLAEAAFTLQGMASRPLPGEAEDLLALDVDLLVDGSPAARLDAIVSRLLLEQGVRSVSWTAAPADPPADEDGGHGRLRLRRAGA